jgi:hypothetical protein
VEARFTISSRGPAIETPAYPALGFVLSQDGNRLNAWFLITLAESLRAVLAAELPESGVGQDEVNAVITPDWVEIVVSEMPDGTALFRESIPTAECAEAVARWQAHLKSMG